MQTEMDLAKYAFTTAPPQDAAWLAYEASENLLAPAEEQPSTEGAAKEDPSWLVRQRQYAAACRAQDAGNMAPGMSDEDLREGFERTWLSVRSASVGDGWEIPVLRYRDLQQQQAQIQQGGEGNAQDAIDEVTIVYYHGGGLVVGEADSEDVSIRRLLRPRDGGAAYYRSSRQSSAPPARITLFSVGYRLMPAYPASTVVADAWDGFVAVRDGLLDSTVAESSLSTTAATGRQPRQRKVIIVGSSSGGELAAFVAQRAVREMLEAGQSTADGLGGLRLTGLILRGPVLSDAFSGLDPYVPLRVRHLHVSAAHRSFETSLLGAMHREVARDGLEAMPLEELAGMIEDEERNEEGGSRENIDPGHEDGQRTTEQRLRLRDVWPRTFIQACTNDTLFSDSICYAALLREALGDDTQRQQVRLDVIQGWPHTFWLKAPGLLRSQAADAETAQALQWILGDA